MSYVSVGATDEVDCAANPTDPVCAAFYAPSASAPAKEPVEIEMPEEYVGKPVAVAAPAKKVAGAAASAAAGQAMSKTTMLLLGVGAVAAIYFMGRK